MKYPIGIQTFSDLRRRGCVYIDKTDLIYRLVSEGKYYFLSRPRRFGKSLLLSTIEAYFQGRRDLFEGLAIDTLETEWAEYPVLHFDFSVAEADDPIRLESAIRQSINEFSEKYNVEILSPDYGIGLQFGSLIKSVFHVTGKRVVVLIDEYDKGIVDVLDNQAALEANQKLLRPFFAQIKAHDADIHFCFITGVSRFRHYTVFSGFNNLDDISLDRRYAAICGITETEIEQKLQEGVQSLALDLGISDAETLNNLRQKYDGYRFTRSEEMVYNPFSLINCLDKKAMDNYWIVSGTSKIFVDYLVKMQFQLSDLENLWVTKELMEGVYDANNPIPLLYQTGYLTIKEIKGSVFRLGIPNGEVRSTLVDVFIPNLMGIKHQKFTIDLQLMLEKITAGDVDGFMTIIQSMVAQVPYQQFDYDNVEKTYHLIIYQIFLMLGIEARSEISMSGGRIDMVAQTDKYVYVMEFKLGGTVEAALAQIDDRGYALPWSADGRTVYKIGAVFSPDTRTLSAWQTQPLRYVRRKR